MKAYFRYQKGYLYEEHGAWYVRYRQRVPQEDGSSKLKHISKHLGRSKDFSNIFAVERCRASFMQTVWDGTALHSNQSCFKIGGRRSCRRANVQQAANKCSKINVEEWQSG
jgi:hypothetical protein